MKTAKIGLLGFGNVGGGTYKILTDNKQIIEKRTGISPEIVKILQRNKKKKRFASADPALLTEDPDDIIKNPEIDIVVEMLGGIEPATSFMVQAMKAGKHVVSANKAAIAANYGLLTETARKSGVRFLFEASVAGGIPVLGFSQRKCKDRKTGRHGSGDGQVGIGCGRSFAFYRESLRTV